MPDDNTPDTESPSHQRPPFADPLADGADPTAPGAPHEPGGWDYNQSRADRAAAAHPAQGEPAPEESPATRENREG